YFQVYLTKDIHTNKEYAIKVCEKRHIIKEKKTEYVKRERDVLNMLSSARVPFFVELYCTFQDADRLYFVLSYAKNGELLPYINKVGAFDVKCSRFYAAEILVAVEHLHRLNIIHRDLKPENILLDENMHILITDFGSAKILGNESSSGGVSGEEARRRNSFVGTAQYVSPELLTDKRALPASDLWALGCIIYQMISGLPPFRSRSEYAIFQKIIKLEYEFPDGFCPKAKDLVQKLLVLNPKERLGSNDSGGKYMSIRNHEFFNGIDWDNLPTTSPPAIHPHVLPLSGDGGAGDDVVGSSPMEPGLDDRQLSRLMGLDLQEASIVVQIPPPTRRSRLVDLTPAEVESRLAHQRSTSKWHSLVEGNLIIKQGLVDKRKGLFARRRMLLLTTGPHLYYVDPVAMVLKGEIPWSPEIRAEAKNFKIFFVHTPNRTYYLEDPEGYALEWCKVIEEMKTHSYNNATAVQDSTTQAMANT
ncbi:hypothetical protein AAG570_013695, partial [Ranatra chinensis]